MRAQIQPSANAAEPVRILDQYGRFFEVNGARFSPDGVPALQSDSGFKRKCYELNPRFGNGWVDMHAFGDGVLVGRINCQFSQSFDDEYAAFPDNIRLNVRLAGHSTLIHSGREQHGASGDILVRNTNPGTLRNHVHGGCLFASIAVDIPRTMLETLQEQGVDVSYLGATESCLSLKTSASTLAQVRELGWRMVGLQTRDSLLAPIELESLGLDLLIKVLEARPSRRSAPGRQASRQWLVALDDVMDILHAEWNQPHTIASLARRAGMNECYLKMFFRQRTGLSVAAYLRGLRMRHARDMVVSGQYTVQQVAQLCGYLHAGKFAQAFRREHGAAPTELR